VEKNCFLLILFFSPFLLSQLVLKDGYVLRDGKFEKVDILVKDGKIEKIGVSLKGKKTENLEGLYIYPGFVDSHLHIYGIGKEMEEVNLKGVKSIEEIVERIKLKYPEIEGGKWIIGSGWDQNLFFGKKLPDNKLISEEFPKNPVVLWRIDGHMLLANKWAIEEAKIKDKKIEGGEIDFKNGLFSDKAMDFFSSAIPKASTKEIEETLKNSLNYLKSLGFVSVCDAGIDGEILKAYISLSRKNEIPIIVYAMLEEGVPYFDEIIKNGKIEKEYFKLSTVKIFMDGALGSWGAYLSIPYKDMPSKKGTLVTDFEKLCSILEKCKKHNFKVAIHSIGDEATTIALKAIEKTKMNPYQVRLEHLQIVKPSDLEKFKKLKVVASVQPYHYTSDLKFLYERIDKGENFLFYPWKTFLKNNILLLFGSDSPVEEANFLEGFFSSISRDVEGLTPYEALNSYTLNNFLFYNEKKMGRIEEGYYANFTVLNKDITKEKEGIWVWGTMVKGKWVYKN
jgi:predicted amidohydrolase YtcJ